MPKRKLIVSWIGTAITNAAKSVRSSSVVSPSTSSSRVAAKRAKHSATPSCSAAARARTSGSNDFIASPSRFGNAIAPFPPCSYCESTGSPRGSCRTCTSSDRDEEQRVSRCPKENYTEPHERLRRAADEGARRGRRHEGVAAPREPPSRPSAQHEALVEM